MKPAALNVDRTQLKLNFGPTERVCVIRMCVSDCVYVRMRTLCHNYNACVLCNTAACSAAQRARQRALRHDLIAKYNECVRVCVRALQRALQHRLCIPRKS